MLLTLPLMLTPTNLPKYLNNLRDSSFTRFERLGESSNLGQAFTCCIRLHLPFSLVLHRNGYLVLGIYVITLFPMHILLSLTFFLSSHELASPLHAITMNSCEVPM
jgi:hypothetical protein